MQCELYIDLFFLVNFIMDICILTVSKKILKVSVTNGRICIGASIGAGLTCLLLLIPLQNSFVRFTICYGLINILMMKTGLKVQGIRNCLKAYITMYVSTFLIGGVFHSFKQYVREGMMFLGAAAISYLIVIHLWKFVCYMSTYHQVDCEVLLVHAKNTVKAKAIIDTGNRLRDCVTGKPVNIISEKVAKALWQEEPLNNLRYIPYHTIGKKEGVLPVFWVEHMCMYLDEEKWVSNILVAVSEDLIDTEGYEMILSPDIG